MTQSNSAHQDELRSTENAIDKKQMFFLLMKVKDKLKNHNKMINKANCIGHLFKFIQTSKFMKYKHF